MNIWSCFFYPQVRRWPLRMYGSIIRSTSTTWMRKSRKMVSLSSPSVSLQLNTHRAQRVSLIKLMVFIIYLCICRVEEVAVRHLLTVRTDFGHLGGTEPEDEGSGLCYFQRGEQRFKCSEIHAGISFLRQTHGRFITQWWSDHWEAS